MVYFFNVNFTRNINDILAQSHRYQWKTSAIFALNKILMQYKIYNGSRADIQQPRANTGCDIEMICHNYIYLSI